MLVAATRLSTGWLPSQSGGCPGAGGLRGAAREVDGVGGSGSQTVLGGRYGSIAARTPCPRGASSGVVPRTAALTNCRY